MAVTFTFTPPCDSRRTTSSDGSPRVLVTGILTYTFGPQEATIRACRSISSNSSAMTSKEMGRSGTAASTSRAKAA